MRFRLTIFHKGLLFLGIPILAQAFFLSILFVMRRDHADADKWAIHTADVIANAETMDRVLQVANSRMMTYVVTGETGMLDRYRRARDRFGAELLTLRERVNDNPPQQASLDRMREIADRLFRLTDELPTLMGPQKDHAAVPQEKIDEISAALDQIRTQMDDFLAVEQKLDHQRREQLEIVHVHQLWSLVGGAALTILSGAILAQIFSRGIGQRLAVLIENTRRLAAGKELVPRVGGHDEISELDRVFHDMADVLVQKDRENSMFVYSVSHDLRSPLVNLQGFSQELATASKELRALLDRDEVPAGTRQAGAALIDRDMGEAVHFIQTGVARLSNIIDAMLRLSRAGRVEYQWGEVDVQKVVRRVVESLWDTISKRSIEVSVGTLPPTMGDAAAVEQVFANLIGNAVNYLDPKRRGLIEIGYRDGGGDADKPSVYYVKDNGLGIPADYRTKVFAAFRRLHPSAAHGEGIGLALVRRVVERHGGRIWVESDVGEGSTFFVALPSAMGDKPARSDLGKIAPELDASDFHQPAFR